MDRLVGSTIPALSGLSSAISVPFSTQRFRSVEVCWLNERWFLERGVDLENPVVLDEVERWLIATFGCGVPREADPPEFYTGAGTPMAADRYGAPGGTRDHGGSGRCGVTGDFNAKGVGATPLVSKTADWYHAHGCMWLEEALREVVLSEVAQAEFPYGAVPAIAVLRINDTVRRTDGSCEPHRAILVRPNFVRLAHFERSILFGNAGSAHSDQYLDAVRTREAIEMFCRHSAGEIQLHLGVMSIHETLERIAKQIGFGWANRLFHGGYFSSNIAVDGALVDFGSFRALPDWRAAYVVTSAAPFGGEVQSLQPIVQSLSFYFSRYGDSRNQIIDCELTLGRLYHLAVKAFEDACLDGISGAGQGNLSGERRDVAAVLWREFQMQQREQVDYFRGEQRRRNYSLYYAFINSVASSEPPSKAAANSASELARLLSKDWVGDGSSAEIRWAAVARWLKPRRLLYRENLIRIISYAINRINSIGSGTKFPFDRLVARLVSASRRRWPRIPRNMVVLGQVLRGCTSALYCCEISEGKYYVVIEGVLIDGCAVFFGSRVPVAKIELSALEFLVGDRAALVVIGVPSWERGATLTLDVAGIDVQVPPVDVVYPLQAEHGGECRWR